MARWLVCAFVFLQVCFLVLTQETTTDAGSVSANDTSPKIPSNDPTPTRVTSKPGVSSTMPPIDHSAGAAAAAPPAPPATNNSADSSTPNSTQNKNTEQKNAALSLYNYNQIVMGSILGVFLSLSAI